MNRTPQAGRRPLKLWHVLLFLLVVLAVIVISGALVERRYSLAAIALVAVALGLPLAARMRRIRASLKPDDDGP